MKPYLESRYVKMCWKRKRTPVAYRAQNEKLFELPHAIKLSSKLRFGKTNSQWKGIEKEKTYINPKV
jgi:hypothetical protein